MPFVTMKEYEDGFLGEKTKLQDELKTISEKDPKALDKFQPPVDRRKSVGGIIGAFFIGFAINFVLSLIAVAIIDKVYPNYDALPEAQKETWMGYAFASMFILPIIAVIVCLIRNAKAKAVLKAYERVKQSQEYQDAERLQSEYQAATAAAKENLKKFEERVNPDNSMGIIYVDGGEPNGGTYMGTLCVDGEENEQVLNYRSAPYEFYIPSGSHNVMIKSGSKIVWQEKFIFGETKVFTIDIAGIADSATLSSDLDKYSSSGRTDIRYQLITKPQYKNAHKCLPQKPKTYVMQ